MNRWPVIACRGRAGVLRALPVPEPLPRSLRLPLANQLRNLGLIFTNQRRHHADAQRHRACGDIDAEQHDVLEREGVADGLCVRAHPLIALAFVAIAEPDSIARLHRGIERVVDVAVILAASNLDSVNPSRSPSGDREMRTRNSAPQNETEQSVLDWGVTS